MKRAAIFFTITILIVSYALAEEKIRRDWRNK